MANITIDGKPYTVKDGTLLIDAIDQAQIGLPRYCYHPGLSVAGNCRICQVEIEKMPRTAIACNTRVTEGMVVHTQSAKAKESQQNVLEFLLANHPLDCPVCDQAGECKLQDYYMDYGLYDPKFDDLKVKKTKKAVAVGPTIMLDQERCILCTRCVRFGDEITKTHDFGVFNRGDRSELDIYPGKQLDNKYSGNVADICPVGALTDRDFRFKMRVWYLGSQDSVCPGCSRGCNIKINFEKSRPQPLKKGRVMRLKPRTNAEVNQWWICDEGRYAYKAIDEGRLLRMRLSRSSNGAQPTWLMLLEKTASLLKDSKPGAWGLLASPQSTNEDLYLMKRLFKDTLKWTSIGVQAAGQEGYEDAFLIKKDKNPNTAGALEILKPAADGDMAPVLEAAKAGRLEGLFIVGHDLAEIAGAQGLAEIRKAVKTIVYVGAHDNDTAEAADVLVPAAVYAEKEGTFTNFQGRVQRIWKAFEPLGPARAEWQIYSDLLALLGQAAAYAKPEQVFADLARTEESFKDLSYKTLGKSGAVWRKP